MPRLSVVIKVLEILMFQELGSFETLGSKLSLGTLKKVADVRNHLRKVLKRLCLQLNSVAVNWVSLLILKEIDGKVRASCLVDVETEHELKAVRKGVTSLVSDDTAESFLFSLCF